MLKGVYEKLNHIQVHLKAPKDQKANNYSYRSCEDIVTALKPFLEKQGVLILISDKMVNLGDRYYVESTATLRDVESGEEVSTVAYAREQENIKIMSEAQLSGSTSSYARKCALNGLLGIDDTKDSDYPHGDSEAPSKGSETPTRGATKPLTEKQVGRYYAIAKGIGYDITKANRALEVRYGLTDPYQLTRTQYDEACKAMEARAKEAPQRTPPTPEEVNSTIANAGEDVPF